MVDSNRIKELVMTSSKVIITSHKDIDMDALGSALGIYYICNNFDKDTHLIIEDEKHEPEVRRALSKLKRKDKIIPTTYEIIKEEIDDNTLLVITDTNKSNRIQNEELLNIKNKILIDHHVESEDSIQELTYKYLDTNESSSVEIVMNLINNLNIYIPSYVATIMLAGIYIDTSSFTLKTNENTHLCAATLYKFDANAKELKYLLKQNFGRYQKRQKLIIKTEFYDKIAITTGGKIIYDNTELAKASDALLTFNNVEASFTIGRLNKETIGISARSLGSIDVQKIMAFFKGGGHKTDAAAQIKGKDVEIIKEKLLKYIRGM
ncbi:MAG TPA: DHH family phosphoesterase [Bacilli bacterium]|nr:DHH family phosphoesterase [Bacilli bacterium]